MVSEKRLKTDTVLLRLEPGEKDYFRKAAEIDGETELAVWMRSVLRRTARKLLGATGPKPAKKAAKKGKKQ